MTSIWRRTPPLLRALVLIAAILGAAGGVFYVGDQIARSFVADSEANDRLRFTDVSITACTEVDGTYRATLTATNTGKGEDTMSATVHWWDANARTELATDVEEVRWLPPGQTRTVEVSAKGQAHGVAVRCRLTLN